MVEGHERFNRQIKKLSLIEAISEIDASFSTLGKSIHGMKRDEMVALSALKGYLERIPGDKGYLAKLMKCCILMRSREAAGILHKLTVESEAQLIYERIRL